MEQPCARDAAGVGDWLTAGLLSRLLREPTDLATDTICTALEYGQRLSALSLPFDGPHGLLTALGTPAIRRAMGNTGLGDMLSELPALPPMPETLGSWSEDCCELCLT